MSGMEIIPESSAEMDREASASEASVSEAVEAVAVEDSIFSSCLRYSSPWKFGFLKGR